MSSSDDEVVGTDSSGNYTINVYNSVPGWIKNLSDSQVGNILAFSSNPFRFVATVISAWVVASVLGVAQYIAATIFAGFDLIVGALNYVLYGNFRGDEGIGIIGLLDWATGGFFGDALGIEPGLLDIFGGLGRSLLLGLAEFEASLISIIVGSGPLGPPLAVGISAITLYALYRALRFLAGIVPRYLGLG